MWQALLTSLALASSGAAAADGEFYGQIQPTFTDQQPATRGPLALAAGLSPGFVALPASGASLDTTLRASAYGITAVGTLWLERVQGQASIRTAWFNELYLSGGGGDWQFSGGRKVVAWDVGYSFRPNDLVQQEVRRTLINRTLTGRPVLMAEHFNANTAWSFVLVNLTYPREQAGADEPALAARVYRRDGALDLYGFARYGAHTGASLGAAAAWVPTEELELHASLRAVAAADTIAIDAAATGLVQTNPWSAASTRHAVQALVGGTWTNVHQFSVLAEAWWDGTALANAQWDAWNLRNHELAGFIATPAPADAIAANLAWQASAFEASTSLRRANLFAQLSWTHDKWQPALDLLYTPADGGRIVTASLTWQGDRVRISAGLRVYGGPSDAVLAQVPTQRVAFLGGTWAF